MKIDLSQKSIRELRFDNVSASDDEKMVASSVRSLVAAHNSIQRIDGLNGLFHSLVHLDLSHNNIGLWPAAYGSAPVRAPRIFMGVAPWIAALPASLHTLNLSHNGICSLSDERTPTSCVCEDGDAMIKEGDDRDVSISTEEDGGEDAVLASLRRACPSTVGLFFNRASFPQLCELDLSHNDFALSLAASDTVEERVDRTVKGLAASFSAEWATRHTSTVSILCMRGNKNLLALNGILCGLPALRELRAAACGITDLTAVAAAATSCPQLSTLDLSNCPVVASIVMAPRTSLATVAEMLLLPYLLSVDRKDTKDVTEEHHKAMAAVARDVAHRKLGEIETALQDADLGRVLYTALVRQIIPQLREIDDGVNVVAAQEAFFKATFEVMSRSGDNGNKRDRRPSPVSPEVLTPRTVQRRSEKNVEAMSGSPLDHPRQSSPVAKKEARTLWQPRRQRHLSGRRLLPPTFASPDCDQMENLQQREEKKRDEEKTDVNNKNVESICVSSTRREQSLNARVSTLAAMAAESAQLRPAVLVTPSAVGRKGGSNGVDNHNSSEMRSSQHTLALSAGVTGRSGGLVRQANTVASHGNESSSAGQLSSFDRTSVSRTTISQMGCNDLSTGTSRMDASDESREKERVGKKARFHNHVDNKGDVCAKSLDSKPSDTTNAPLHIDQTTSAQLSASRIDTDNEHEITSDAGGGGGFQRALAALTPLLAQRLRAEGLSLRGAHRATTAASASSSSSPPALDPPAIRHALEQRAQALEAALLASQERQRDAKETIAALANQLRADRQLITDQRREAARMREEREALTTINRTARRRLQKRQKEIVYGAQALQRREAQQRRERALREIERETARLRAAERRYGEQLAREKGVSINGIDTERKTRGDVLRERAVRERMAAAAQREDPLAYAPRRFRINDTSAESEEERSGGSAPGAHSAGTVAKAAVVSAATANNRTPWKRQTLYDRGHSPYAEESEDADHTDLIQASDIVDDSAGVTHGSDENFSEVRGDALQTRSLQQLFDEAATIRQRQYALQQRMQAVSRNSPNDAIARTRVLPMEVDDVDDVKEERQQQKEEKDNGGGVGVWISASYATETVDISTCSVTASPIAQNNRHDDTYDDAGSGQNASGITDTANMDNIAPNGDEESRIQGRSEKEKKESDSRGALFSSGDAQRIYEEIIRQQRLQLAEREGEIGVEISRISDDDVEQYNDEQQQVCDAEANVKVKEGKKAKVPTRRSLFA